jgi:uncharacterized protein (DUF58 family)
MPTKRGWAAFATGLGLWIGARFIGSRDLHMIAAGIVVLPFLAALFVQWSRIRIEVRRHLSSVRVFPGVRVTVNLAVVNHGPITAPFLLLEDAMSPGLGKPARLVVTGIPPHNEQRVSYSILCKQRGRFLVGPASIFISDPFGLARVRIPTAQENELVVYPACEEIEVRKLALTGAGSGDSTVRQLHRSIAEFYTMREYVQGDDLRRIHWPSVARTGNLMIRQDESTRRSSATVFLDNRTAGLGAAGSAPFERGVSVAATISRALLRAGFSVRLATVDNPATLMNEERLLETLAGVSTTRVHNATDSLRALRNSALADTTLGMVVAPPLPAELTALTRIGSGFGRKLAVLVYPVDLAALPEERATELETRASLARAALQRSGWEVYVLQPGERLAESWRRSNQPRKLQPAGSST